MYQRVPTNKMRHDPRQGLIDQDPEFIEFLESLTNPTVRPQNIDASREGKDEPVKVTPLIQHLRDKKAAKEKSKGDKSTKSGRGSKAAAAGAKTEAKVKDATDKGDTKASRRRKADGPKKETTVQQSPKVAAAVPAVAKSDQAKPTAIEGRKRERPASGAGAAASLIQRDLGLRGGRAEGGRRGGAKGASATKNSTSESNTGTSTTESASATKSLAPSRASKATATPAATPAPSVLKRQQPNAPSTAAQQTPNPAPNNKTASSSSQPKTTSISPTATQAFLKHANPSQGITEATLQAALSVFGSVSNIEIDKRKGFAYATFAEPKGLQAAAAAGLIPVAQGNVQVLERKERSKPAAASESKTSTPPASSSATPAQQTNTGSGRGGRGGARSGRGRGGNARGGAAAAASAAGGSGTAAKEKPAATVASASSAT